MENVFLFFAAASALCDVSSFPARKYHFVYEPKTWNDAQSFCREHYLDLATIDNMDDMNILKKMGDLEKMQNFWIGLYDNWKWSASDGEYRNWDFGQPATYNTEENCVAMGRNGRWYDAPCEWYNRPACSDGTGLNVTFVRIDLTLNWTEAQKYCRKHHTDLVTIRDDSENQKVNALVPVGADVWIGLYRTTWEWADKSNSSFRNWKSGEPNNVREKNCAAVGESGTWEDDNCAVEKPFICNQVAVSQKVLKVKLVTTSPLDLEDPAVLENLLKQLELKLQQQGGKPDVKLSWRKQTDGKIFHKEEDI
ncbi:macrophage mannose receptor 1-like [Fundulus heteroclitus]|uniref:macrophage mannose receptor 1-like n=1 Tax=Fundulus heteroclitus TaxID=8078 RepID=UPI00165BDDDD|nr:macrophage mannose receptor 1-like [Fundulus heteroclitus]